MDTLENLLAEIRAIAPVGSSVSVDAEIWSHAGAPAKREWKASVHVDGVSCPHGGCGMVAHERADSPALLVAMVGARVIVLQCVCSRCRADRELARLEAHDIDSEPEVASAYRAYREVIEAIPAHHLPVEAEDVAPDEYRAYREAYAAAEARHEEALDRARAAAEPSKAGAK